MLSVIFKYYRTGGKRQLETEITVTALVEGCLAMRRDGWLNPYISIN